MTDWSVRYLQSALADLKRLDNPIRRRVMAKLDWLVRHYNSVTLVMLKGEFSDYFKLRVGDWRVFYRIDRENHIILVHMVRHRSSSYKG